MRTNRKRRLPRRAVVLIAAAALSVPSASAAILRVAEGATGAGNGSSWTNAHPKLQDALAAAVAGDEIWVAAGVYYPDERAGQPDGTAASVFSLKVSVPLYGGFAGSETARTGRDPVANLTVLSGDIGQNDTNTDGNRIAESSTHIVATNASTVVCFKTGTGTTRLDGFTVTAGSGTGAGGGLYVSRAGLTVANCRFLGNKATHGGGTYLSFNSAVFTKCEFSGNSAASGGAAYITGPGALLTHCVMSGNTAAQYGGAVYASEAAQAVNCLFFDNGATTHGGAWYQNGSFATPVITQCTMMGNTASLGGAFYSASGQVALRNSILWGNTATSSPVVLASSIAGSALPTVSRCDIAGSGGSSGWKPQTGTDLGGNIDVNPQFLGTASSADPTLAFRPLAGSPVVDAGLAAHLSADITDLDGDANIAEAIPVDLSGAPRSVGVAPDMGVFETGSGPAIITPVPLLKFIPNSGHHAAALDLSEIFDFTAQSFALAAATPSSIATATVDSLNGGVSITPLANATGVATLVVSATNASGLATYIQVRIEVFPAVFHVAAGATGAASGLTWADAFPTLQDALIRGGAGHEIWVAEGVYFPDQGGGFLQGSTAAKFVIPPGITLRGGFAGTESSASEADPATHPTILSGDIGHDDVNTDGDHIAETTTDHVGANTPGFLTLTGAPADTGIDGFILTAAGGGGALKITGGNPFVRRCRFSGNSGTNGGAVLVESSASAEFSTCSFSGNLASTSGGALRANSSALAFDNCSFTGNTSNSTGGGGALNLSSSVVSLRGCTFSQNICPGVFGNGGAVRGTDSSLQAVGCPFLRNEGYDGGALYLSGTASVSLTNCPVMENLARSNGGAAYIDGIDAVLTGCGFAANRATYSGGALYHYDCSPFLTLCTLAGNASGQQGGAIYNRTWDTADPAAPVLRNCIIWGNQKGYATVPAGASVEDLDTIHAATFSNCIIAHSGGSAAWNSELGIDVGSNLDADPRFLLPPVPGATTPQAIDLRVQAGSPAINAGFNAAVPADLADVDRDADTAEPLPIDIAGIPRIAGSNVDLGAHEAEPGPSLLAAAPRLRFDPLSGLHGSVLNASTLFGPTAVEFAVEAQSSSSVISAQVGAATGSLDFTVFPETFGTTLVVVRATDASGRSSYQTMTVDVYPPVVYVNSAATGSANGLSWQNAFPTLHAALQFPRINGIPLEIRVAQGVYRPDDGPGQIADAAASTFRMPANCRVYGGFAGNEGQRDARDPLAHPTILSGDLANDDLNADGNFIAETIDAITGTNATRVVTADACLAGDALDGFIITAADGGSSGGGLSCTGGALAAANCLFQGNRGIWGGGVSFKDASAVLTNCRFTANRADARGLSFTTAGGAGYFLNSTVTLTGCRFVANHAADSDGGSGDGGAVYVYGGTSVTMTGCDFEDTVAGGAVEVKNMPAAVSDCRITGTLAGGGLKCSNAATTLTRCVISGNHGGGLNFGGDVPLTCVDTVISGNSKSGDGGGAAIWGHQPVRFTNCLITGNSCWNFGGGIDSWARDAVFTNCTFSANRSTSRGGAFYAESGSSQRFINCILWANETAGSTTTSFATLVGSPYETPPAYFRTCIVANSGGSVAWKSLSGFDDGGNLDADPRFLVPLSPAAAPSISGDFQLGYQSPALDAGANAPVSASTDLAHAPRITNGIVDIGAYEGQDDQFDLDGDGLSDAFELAHTLPPSRTSLAPGTDADGDGRSNLLEFALGMNPLAADQDGVPQSSILEDDGHRYLSIRYPRNRWATQFLTIEVERSIDPGAADPWSTGKTTVAPFSGFRRISADLDR